MNILLAPPDRLYRQLYSTHPHGSKRNPCGHEAIRVKRRHSQIAVPICPCKTGLLQGMDAKSHYVVIWSPIRSKHDNRFVSHKIRFNPRVSTLVKTRASHIFGHALCSLATRREADLHESAVLIQTDFPSPQQSCRCLDKRRAADNALDLLVLPAHYSPIVENVNAHTYVIKVP